MTHSCSLLRLSAQKSKTSTDNRVVYPYVELKEDRLKNCACHQLRNLILQVKKSISNLDERNASQNRISIDL